MKTHAWSHMRCRCLQMPHTHTRQYPSVPPLASSCILYALTHRDSLLIPFIPPLFHFLPPQACTPHTLTVGTVVINTHTLTLPPSLCQSPRIIHNLTSTQMYTNLPPYPPTPTGACACVHPPMLAHPPHTHTHHACHVTTTLHPGNASQSSSLPRLCLPTPLCPASPPLPPYAPSRSNVCRSW